MINLWVIIPILLIILFCYNRVFFAYFVIGIIVIVNAFKINKLYKRKLNGENVKDESLVLFNSFIKSFINVAGVDLELENAQIINQDFDDNVIIVGNHTSNLDVMNIFYNTNKKYIQPLAKIEMKSKIPIFNKLMICIDSYFINRDDLRESMKVMMQINKNMETNQPVLIYPEGTRQDYPHNFKSGSFMPISKNGGYVIPTCNLNLRNGLEKRKKFSLFYQGKSVVLEPIYFEKNTSTQEITQTVYDVINNYYQNQAK